MNMKVNTMKINKNINLMQAKTIGNFKFLHTIWEKTYVLSLGMPLFSDSYYRYIKKKGLSGYCHLL